MLNQSTCCRIKRKPKIFGGGRSDEPTLMISQCPSLFPDNLPHLLLRLFCTAPRSHFGGTEKFRGVLWAIYTPLFPQIALNLYRACWTLVMLVKCEKEEKPDLFGKYWLLKWCRLSDSYNHSQGLTHLESERALLGYTPKDTPYAQEFRHGYFYK